MIWGGLFHDINLKNIDAIVIPRFSSICFGDIGEKFTRALKYIFDQNYK